MLYNNSNYLINCVEIIHFLLLIAFVTIIVYLFIFLLSILFTYRCYYYVIWLLLILFRCCNYPNNVVLYIFLPLSMRFA